MYAIRSYYEVSGKIQTLYRDYFIKTNVNVSGRSKQFIKVP